MWWCNMVVLSPHSKRAGLGSNLHVGCSLLCIIGFLRVLSQGKDIYLKLFGDCKVAAVDQAEIGCCSTMTLVK